MLLTFDRLAKADPGNAGWQRDLSVSHDKIGDVQFKQGDLTAALTSYQASLAIRDRLAKADPGNAGWQREDNIYPGVFERLLLTPVKPDVREGADILQRFKSTRCSSVFSTSIPPFTTPSTINDISFLGPHFGSSEPKQPPAGKMWLPSHETGSHSGSRRGGRAPIRIRSRPRASFL
jgi:hypothetical protein